MSAENKIVSVEFDVNNKIDDRVKTILEGEPVSLPGRDDPLVMEYIRKIEGSYDVSRSKQDTDHAINLLYIAYNTTPQNRGNVRVGIDKLMTQLIAAQQDSEAKMRIAVEDSHRLYGSLCDMFEGWEEVRVIEDPEELKAFIGEDMIDLAEEIKSRSEKISNDLAKVAETYQGIINDTNKVVNDSEKALAEELENKAAVEEEIKKNNAEREKLESLVADLQRDIEKYEKMSNEYKARAESAEDKAFIMSIIRVGAQMITGAIPMITAGLTGGTSLIAGAAASTTQQIANSQAAASEDDNTAEVIEKKKEAADKTKEIAVAEKEKTDLEEKGKELAAEKQKAEEDESADADTKTKKVESIEQRIAANDEAIKKKEGEIAAAKTALEAANESLKALDRNLEQMAEKQDDQAASLRQLQMQMLEKVESYEKERREQAAELVKINALLTGQRTKEETIQLAIKSLNLSLKALKRMREIIVEISFFFSSFAAFMQQVMEGSERQTALIQQALDKERFTKTFAKRIRKNTDDFFVRQAAEWQAVEVVSTKFVACFNDGWSQLNKLSGKYLTGDELKGYLESAAVQIEEISFNRQKASTAKLADLDRYRKLIEGDSAANG